MTLRTRVVLFAGLLIAVSTLPATGQTRRDEQFYYPGDFNWQFLDSYPEAARLFNAFDYGHAVLYQRLYSGRGQAQEALEKEYLFLTTDLLVRPPRFAVAEEAIEPAYAKIAWRAKMMFDWAHVLHRQIYDAYADERLTIVEKDSLIERLTDYYLSNRRYAFTSQPKSMALMDEQHFSQIFRKEYPKFNGLIWSYHWLQVGLYEPFIEGKTKAEKKAGVQATVARFWSMLEDAPNRFPKLMPMTSAIAPQFSAAHPRAAIIFDNLHMAHDIISDVLTSDRIPYDQKGAVINAQLEMLQDSTRDVISVDEWRMMADHMGGVAVMGGPATGLLKIVSAEATPAPGMQRGEDHQGMNQMERVLPSDTTRMDPAQAHAEMKPGPDSLDSQMKALMELHQHMMGDSVIRRRILADTALRRTMDEIMRSMPEEHRRMMEQQMRQNEPPPARRPARRPPPSIQPVRPSRDSQPNHQQHRPDSTSQPHKPH
jgi:hypothetical protein